MFRVTRYPVISQTESGRGSKGIPGSGAGSGTRWALVRKLKEMMIPTATHIFEIKKTLQVIVKAVKFYSVCLVTFKNSFIWVSIYNQGNTSPATLIYQGWKEIFRYLQNTSFEKHNIEFSNKKKVKVEISSQWAKSFQQCVQDWGKVKTFWSQPPKDWMLQVHAKPT